MSDNGGLGWAVGAPGRVGRFFDRLRGRPVEFDLRSYLPTLGQVRTFDSELRSVSDGELTVRASALAAAARAGTALSELLPETFAVACEAAERAVAMRPYDVQVIGGIALHQGKLIEMQTGEGKTLVAVLPASLQAFLGHGVHVLTFNDYLAERDATWMEPVYRLLGLRVGFVRDGISVAERQAAYQADVTYLTAKEAGFDYLRDGLCYDARLRVHRPLHAAIVDEADSILIDEARIPLVIAGHTGSGQSELRLSNLAGRLRAGVDYETDDPGRNVFLTECGLARAEAELGAGNLHDSANADLLTSIHVALHAEALLTRDVDYIVRAGRLQLVDELTGRVVPDRHWPDGLQAAVEAKEGIRAHQQGDVLGTISLQHLVGHYPKLCGMTGTVRPEEVEFKEQYGLDTVALPTHRCCIRRDRPDRVFTQKRAKLEALVDEISRLHERGRPVLVGTTSVRESEEVAARLHDAGVHCQVLNAKTDEPEARIVAEAGGWGAVTISTNMAGRGTDIKLGGRDERQRQRVLDVGGLFLVGTNRHESQRIDLQLRGRAGRQGDPGDTCFFVSLEDDLIERFGVDDVLSAKRRQSASAAIDDPLVNRRIAWAQRVVEGQNTDIRSTLSEYSSLLEEQHQLVRQRRREILDASELTLCRQACPERYVQVADRVGNEQAVEVERLVTLHTIDRLWARHLARTADVREGIHMVRLGGQNPLAEFRRRADQAFSELLAHIDEQIVATFERIDLQEGVDALARQGIGAPAATWTYLVDDNPFENSLKSLLTGHNVGLSVAAALLGPLYMLLALYQRYFKRKGPRER